MQLWEFSTLNILKQWGKKDFELFSTWYTGKTEKKLYLLFISH